MEKTRSLCRFLLLLALLLTVLTACGKEEEAAVFHMECDGKVYTVNHTEQTITVDGSVCSFSVTEDGGQVELEVLYPDGSTYQWSRGDRGGYGDWSEDYDPDKYISGEEVWDILQLEQRLERDRSDSHPVLGGVLLLLGIVHLAFPRKMWELQYGWRYENAEPTDVALQVEAISGLVIALIGAAPLFT